MLNSYKKFVLINESKKEEKLKNKIKKFFTDDYIIDKVIKLHPKLSIWIINQLIKKVKNMMILVKI